MCVAPARWPQAHTTAGPQSLLPPNMTMQRPEEAERDGGRTPLTVLQPRPELATGGALSRMAAASLHSQPPAAARGGGGTLAASFNSASAASSAEPSASSQQLPQQQSGRRQAVAEAPDPHLPLKLVMSPQRARTVISFDERLAQVRRAACHAHQHTD
jgi:hypothetical protein